MLKKGERLGRVVVGKEAIARGMRGETGEMDVGRSLEAEDEQVEKGGGSSTEYSERGGVMITKCVKWMVGRRKGTY